MHHIPRKGDGEQRLEEKLFRPENVEIENYNGTVIGILFYNGEATNTVTPIIGRARRYIKNLLNIISIWTNGCIRFDAVF